MNDRIAHRWERLAASGRRALIPYVTPEYPFRDVFGISTAEQVAAVWRHADGAVVGSALIKAMAAATSAGQAATLGAEFFATLRPKESFHA
ncbi:MAG: tryptophan synthase subunit alpha [Bacteroidota bacterium]